MMKDRDKKRFLSSMTWFNQFFEGLNQIYHHVVNLLPVEVLPDGFSVNVENFYYPSLKTAPSIPPYYALVLPGRQAALQIISVIDADAITHGGLFHPEPCMVIVVHSLPDKYAWVDEFALKVIKGQETEQIRKENDVVWGKLTGKYPADFFAFQVQYDRFSDVMDPPQAVSQWLVGPILTNLAKGFSQPEDQSS
jgi:hypothetical protein